MEMSEIEPILKASERLVGDTSLVFKRSLYGKINWNDRLICIKGPKGTGKTTLILQHIREAFGVRSDKAVYLAMDHMWFSSHQVLDVVEWLYDNGYTHVFLDEIHHASEWQRLIKTIVDFYPRLHVVYSGSSVLKLTTAKADLSRRQAVYTLKGLSFREFLTLEGIDSGSAISIDELVSKHLEIAGELSAKVKILPLFRRYLHEGYYPLYRDVASQFSERLSAIVANVLETDVPAVMDVTPSTIRKIKKMLMILSESCPQTPNMTALYRELETDRNAGVRMFDVLEGAELVSTLVGTLAKPKLKRMGVVEKVFLGDTNLMYALVPNPEMGAVRETFFANQCKAAGYEVVTPAQGDFIVSGRLRFEVGGKKKSFRQIADIPDSFVVADDTDVGRGNKLPLWLFGFLY